jgi:hypothetical protein
MPWVLRRYERRHRLRRIAEGFWIVIVCPGLDSNAAVEVLTATRLQRRASDVTDPSDPCQPHLGVAGRPARPGEVM